LALSAQGADSVQTWFKEGSVKGNIKYYYIQTDKEKSDGSKTSAHANAIGGTFNYTTGDLYGFQTGVTFMSTNGFALPDTVDTSILGRDNGVRLENDPSGKIAQDSFSVLGELFIKYTYEDFSALYGRRVIKTPLLDAKEVRMLPSAVQGAFLEYKMESGTRFGASYLTHFKQRTSDAFINIVEHALGANTRLITGEDEGEVIVVDAVYKSEKTSIKLYDYFADNFMNSVYMEAGFKNRLPSQWSYAVDAQYINQRSVGYADEYLNNTGSQTGGKQISANAFSLKFGLGYDESRLDLAYSEVLKDSDSHDALVLPWDGTPLFTNMITSNDLFQSNYGNALNADSIYIGGSRGIKLNYSQTYDFTGVKGFKTALSYLNVDNDKFIDKQEDFNAVIAYGTGGLSIALKGILVHNDSSGDKTGTVSQLEKLTQYRVIANYKF